MVRKAVFALTLIWLCNYAWARTFTIDQIIQIIYDTYHSGDYEKTERLLDAFEKRVSKLYEDKEKMQGLIEYWRGLTYAKLNEYDLAILHFNKALEYNYNAEDMYYEIAQAYYISDKLVEARQQFRNSVKKGYKRGVSLYYIAFISQQLGDVNKAAKYFNAIEKLPYEEKKDVMQAARMQLADIYLAKVELMPDSFKKIEELVIPQYQKALLWDDNSSLAPEIQEKIEKLQKKYDLVLFKMRNGRPTARPPYFLKANILYGTDSNVNLIDKTSVKEASVSEIASNYYSVGTFGRYTFYPNSLFTFSPEFQFNLTKYLSEEEVIFAGDNYSYTTGLKTTYEHIYNNAPATIYFDIELTKGSDDANADKAFEKSYDLMAFTLSEELQFWEGHPSIFRIKQSTNTNVDETATYTTTSVMYEQLISFNSMTLYTYTAYDMSRYPELDSYDNDALTIRVDFIFSSIWGLFNPNLYVSQTVSNYFKDDAKESTTLNSYGFNLNRPLTTNTYIYLDFSQSIQSAVLDSDNYEKQSISLNIDYFY